MKKIIFISIPIILLIIILSVFSIWNNIFFRAVDAGEVEEIHLYIDNIYNYQENLKDTSIMIADNPDSINNIIALEDLLRKNDGYFRMVKSVIWTISIEYTLKSGKIISREYKGQGMEEKLWEELSQIEEVRNKITSFHNKTDPFDSYSGTFAKEIDVHEIRRCFYRTA